MKLKSQSLPLYMWCFIVIQISSVTVSEASSSVPGGAGSNETNGTSTPGSVSDTNPSKLNAAVPTEGIQMFVIDLLLSHKLSMIQNRLFFQLCRTSGHT